MDQLSLTFDRQHTALTFVVSKPEVFHRDFHDWLSANFHVYEAFERRALSLWRAGRAHYGHRSLWEVLRYETAVAEREGEYKLNNNMTKSVAILFEMMNEQCKGLFEFREREAA